ncbi:hypothetical protein HYT56_03540 [Candidatus Woesearchaeota archaeon]|nr:hypothetical protein [Candidatus Woesearchaeota archaeon]
MVERILTNNEKKFLTIVVGCYNIGIGVQWKALYDAELSRGRIHEISKKFRREGLIEKDSYNVRKEKIKEVKELLKYNQEIEEGYHRIWKPFLLFMILFVIAVILLIISFWIHQSSPEQQINIQEALKIDIPVHGYTPGENITPLNESQMKIFCKVLVPENNLSICNQY